MLNVLWKLVMFRSIEELCNVVYDLGLYNNTADFRKAGDLFCEKPLAQLSVERLKKLTMTRNLCGI